MFEITQNQWNTFLQKNEERDKRLENVAKDIAEIRKNLDSKIDNKINESLVKHFGQKYQYLLTFFAAISVFLVINFFFARDLKADLKEDMQHLMSMQYKNQGKFIEPAKKLESDRASLKLQTPPAKTKESKKSASL